MYKPKQLPCADRDGTWFIFRICSRYPGFEIFTIRLDFGKVADPVPTYRDDILLRTMYLYRLCDQRECPRALYRYLS